MIVKGKPDGSVEVQYGNVFISYERNNGMVRVSSFFSSPSGGDIGGTREVPISEVPDHVMREFDRPTRTRYSEGRQDL